MRLSVCIALVLTCGVTTAALAQDPVKFDARRLFSCAEVKPPQQADTARKVIVIVIPISANFHADVEESTIESLRYELRFPRSVTVFDHLPKTRSETDIVGAVQQKDRVHQVSDVNVKFSGGGRVGFSVYGVGVNLGGDAEKSKRDFKEVETNIQLDRLPPRGQVIVAGTDDEGQTLYFELKWFNQITRAGQTDYAFLAQVPKNWTGDVATLSCTARRNGAVAGRLNKVVGLYLSGNDDARERVEKQLETARPAAEVKELVTNTIGTRLKLLPAGSYLMGATPDDTEAYKDEKPQHKATISRPFYLGVKEVTQYEYRQVMNDNPSHFKDSELLPVEEVSWLDAVKFCNKLSERERRRPYYKIEDKTVTILGGNGYRLPTEAEWEYACRAPQSADSATKHPFGGNEANLSSYAWFSGNSEQKTHPVGQKKPNRWGLYDMQGNVCEWCQDFYSDVYYSVSPETDPAGPAQVAYRVIRGGSWFGDPRNCRPAFRSRGEPDFRYSILGFRLASDQQ